MKLSLARVALVAAAVFVAPAFAKVTQQEADRLKTGDLTPVGAEKAGNKDGSIGPSTESSTSMSLHSGAFSGGNRGSEIAADTAQRSTTLTSGNSAFGYPIHPRRAPRTRNVTNAPARRPSGISGIGD